MIKPLGNRVLVKRENAKTTRGGIILPDSAQEKQKIGEVIATGPGKIDEEGNLLKINVSVGDKVIFGSYAGSEVKMDEPNAQYLIMGEDEILGVLE